MTENKKTLIIAIIACLMAGTAFAAIPQNQKSCEAVGGKWKQMGIFQGNMGCLLPPKRARDAGKPCTDGDQCESKWCEGNDGDHGKCHDDVNWLSYGCRDVIEKGKAQSLCAD